MFLEFVMEVVKILVKYDIFFFVFESLWLILELFFVVCYFKVFVGIMIMVFYNLVVYNGYKVYGEDGG